MRRDNVSALTALDLRVLKAVLKLNTNNPPTISQETQLTERVVREALQRLGLEGEVGLSRERMIEVAVGWLEKSRSFEEVSRSLTWELFEVLVARILEEAGLYAIRNVTVIIGSKRAQLDIIALRESTIYLLECKRWMRSLSGSLALTEAKKLRERANLFCQALLKLLGHGATTHYAVPILVSPYASPAISEAFISPFRSLIRLLSEHPATLPSPPTILLQLGQRLSPHLLKSNRIKVSP
ncbi:MAG: nuclease-related domain-containing protein [Nitrososphaerota archaeon]